MSGRSGECQHIGWTFLPRTLSGGLLGAVLDLSIMLSDSTSWIDSKTYIGVVLVVGSLGGKEIAVKIRHAINEGDIPESIS